MQRLLVGLLLLSSLSFGSSCHTMYNNVKKDSDLMVTYFKNDQYGATYVVTERLIKTINTILTQCDYQLDYKTKNGYRRGLERIRDVQDVCKYKMRGY